jgi:hypothetical protein
VVYYKDCIAGYYIHSECVDIRIYGLGLDICLEFHTIFVSVTLECGYLVERPPLGAGLVVGVEVEPH